MKHFKKRIFGCIRWLKFRLRSSIFRCGRLIPWNWPKVSLWRWHVTMVKCKQFFAASCAKKKRRPEAKAMHATAVKTTDFLFPQKQRESQLSELWGILAATTATNLYHNLSQASFLNFNIIYIITTHTVHKRPMTAEHSYLHSVPTAEYLP